MECIELLKLDSSIRTPGLSIHSALETHNSSCAQQPNRRSSCAIVLVCAILVVALQLLHAPPQHKQAKPKWLRERARTIPGHHHTKMLAKRRRELSARSTGFNWKLAVPAYIDQWTKQLPRRSQERDRARPGREVSLYAHFDGTCESTCDTPAILQLSGAVGPWKWHLP